MMKQAAGSRVRRFLWAGAAAIGACCPHLSANAQESAEQNTDDAKSIEEIVIVVDRAGKPVNKDALHLEEIRLKIIREFLLEQTEQEEELWRLKLRSAMKRSTSRIAWGYDAQAEAAGLRYSHANYLPIDRVRPTTLVSIRF